MSAEDTGGSIVARLGLWALVPVSAVLGLVGLALLAAVVAYLSYAGFSLLLSWISSF